MLTLLLAVAHAAPEYPLPAAARPPTLPRASVRVEADSTIGTGPGPADVDLAAGFAVGVTDELELGAQVLPFDVAPTLEYTAPSLYGAYAGELSDVAYLTPSVRLFVPVLEGDRPLADAAATLRLMADQALRLDLGGATRVAFGEEVEAAFAAPVSVVLQPDRRLFVTADSAVSTDPFDTRFRMPEHLGDRSDVYVPFGASMGVTMGRANRSLTDVSLGVHFPSLARFEGGQSALRTDDFLVMAAVRAAVPTDPTGQRRRGVTRPRHP